MHTGKRQIPNLWSQDVSKELLSDLVRKDVAEFNDIFYRLQHAALEMFKGAFNNYSTLKLHYFHQQSHFFNAL